MKKIILRWKFGIGATIVIALAAITLNTNLVPDYFRTEILGIEFAASAIFAIAQISVWARGSQKKDCD